MAIGDASSIVGVKMPTTGQVRWWRFDAVVLSRGWSTVSWAMRACWLSLRCWYLRGFAMMCCFVFFKSPRVPYRKPGAKRRPQQRRLEPQTMPHE